MINCMSLSTKINPAGLDCGRGSSEKGGAWEELVFWGGMENAATLKECIGAWREQGEPTLKKQHRGMAQLRQDAQTLK